MTTSQCPECHTVFAKSEYKGVVDRDGVTFMVTGNRCQTCHNSFRYFVPSTHTAQFSLEGILSGRIVS